MYTVDLHDKYYKKKKKKEFQLKLYEMKEYYKSPIFNYEVILAVLLIE